jgi:hypothetical protein
MCDEAYLDDMCGCCEVEGDVAVGVSQSQVHLWVLEGLQEEVKSVWMACLGSVVERGVAFEILKV